VPQGLLRPPPERAATAAATGPRERPAAGRRRPVMAALPEVIPRPKRSPSHPDDETGTRRDASSPIPPAALPELIPRPPWASRAAELASTGPARRFSCRGARALHCRLDSAPAPILSGLRVRARARVCGRARAIAPGRERAYACTLPEVDPTQSSGSLAEARCVLARRARSLRACSTGAVRAQALGAAAAPVAAASSHAADAWTVMA
jgi:hypothetical protein